MVTCHCRWSGKRSGMARGPATSTRRSSSTGADDASRDHGPAGDWTMAFLLSFTSLTVAGIVWMGLFVWLGAANNASLNAAAEWLSPEGIVGWTVYLALAIASFLALVR